MIHHLIIFITFYLMQQIVFAQTDSIVNFTKQYPIEDDITYKGGKKRLIKLLQKNFNYPPQAINDSISGTVYVYFTIDTKGHSTDVIVIKGIREDLDNEAIWCIDLLDNWNVGRQNGKKIKLHHIIPVKFSLTENKKMYIK